MIDNGSNWLKWDLHIHSLASDGNGSPTELILVAKAKGLSVIALTDHHTVKNLDETKALGVKHGIKVISGVEFRSEYGSKSVHFIGLFPDTYNGIELNQKAIEELILNPLGISETVIVAKGKSQTPGIGEDAAFKAGMFFVQVDFKVAANLIHKYGGLVSVHAGSKENSIDKEMRHEGSSKTNTELYNSLGPVKEELFERGYIDICEIRKENDSDAFYLKTFGKPSIIASDAHDKSEIGSKFTWIKAKPTFDGLRQIVFEPKDRVSLTLNKPDLKNDYQIIESIKISHPDFDDQEIFLNQNLNAIIGGRSSGKSLLLGTLAKAIGSVKEVKPGKPDFDNYIKTDLLPNVSIKWRDALPGEKRRIDYFPQSFINSLAADSKEISSIIERIIKSDLDKKSKLENLDKDRIRGRTEINSILSEYQVSQHDLESLESQMFEIGSKEGVEKQIHQLQIDIEEVKRSFSDPLSAEEDAQFLSLKLESESIAAVTSEDYAEIHLLEQIKSYPIFNELDPDSIQLSDVMVHKVTEKYQALKDEFNQQWHEHLANLSSELKDSIEKRALRNAEIIKDDTFVKCAKYYAENEQYTTLNEKLSEENKKLQKIIAHEELIRKGRESVATKLNLLIDTHIKQYHTSIEAASHLSFAGEEISISCEVHFKNEEFCAFLQERIAQRASDWKEISQFQYSSITAYQIFVEDMLKKSIKHEIPLKGGFDSQQFAIEFLTLNPFDLVYDVVYEGDNLNKMSEGKKAFVVLRLLLDFNKQDFPILIDQPEDDLDNRAIYTDLVKYLTTKKKNRQIIVVTHNPNIVVGGDAELIICANQDGVDARNRGNKKFAYLTGALEDSIPNHKSDYILESQGIREHVCDILEGGDIAFRKRENKYMIHRQ